MGGLNLTALVLIIVGGLNWLLFGLFQWDLVGGLLGGMDGWPARIVYILVGVAAIYSFTLINKVKANS
ncbi:DUF378 domain-containing protein [Ammoniphilus sp. CFH 90114]|uniref:DUF378 domain-containing protein n=1 Tax=Ammoniphilus sp. CFH 90114 TaxID=2493665 RepID=UPI00100DB9FC|nr:DUF378 domain-containing protein [Ammoniphilus sp. CFH 90114]RXT06326.1 DUF378 domain-containing protein [Ammoniphilus sp. CFH 90114]